MALKMPVYEICPRCGKESAHREGNRIFYHHSFCGKEVGPPDPPRVYNINHVIWIPKEETPGEKAMIPKEFQSWFAGFCEGMGDPGVTPTLSQWKEIMDKVELMDTGDEMTTPAKSGTDVLQEGMEAAGAKREPEKKLNRPIPVSPYPDDEVADKGH